MITTRWRSCTTEYINPSHSTQKAAPQSDVRVCYTKDAIKSVEIKHYSPFCLFFSFFYFYLKIFFKNLHIVLVSITAVKCLTLLFIKLKIQNLQLSVENQTVFVCFKWL